MVTYLSGGRIQGSTTAPATATFSEDNTSDNFTQVIGSSGVPLSPETRWGVDYQNVYAKTVGQHTLFNDDTLNFDGDTIKGGMRYTGTPDNGSLRSVKVYIKKTGSPTGSVYMKLYKNQTLGSGATSATETSTTTLDISTLTTTYSYVTFTFAGTNTLETNDIIAIEYPSGGSGSNKLNVGWDAGTGTAGWSMISMYGTSSPANQWTNENTGRSFTWVIKAGSTKGLTVNASRNNGIQGEYISLGSTYSGNFLCRFSYKALIPSDEWSYGSGAESYAPYLHVGLCSLNTCNQNTTQNFAGFRQYPYATDSQPTVCFAHDQSSIHGLTTGGNLTGSWTGSNSVENGTTENQYYMEIVKDGDTVTVNAYTDSSYSTLYGTNSITRSGSETSSYSYFVGMGMDFATNPYGTLSAFIDDIQIWKDTTTPTGDEKATITNVPLGSRYEETDTRKIYRMALSTDCTGTATGSTSNTTSGYIRATKLTASASATITTIRATLSSVTGNVKFAIYSDDSDSPDALLATTGSKTAVNGESDYALSSSYAVTSGTDYWVSIQASTDAVHIVSGGGGAHAYAYAGSTAFATAPNPYPSHLYDTTGFQFCIYPVSKFVERGTAA